MVGLLKKCHSHFKDYQTAEKVDEKSVTIPWAAPSVFGVGTPQRVFGIFGDEDLESGFGNRWIILPYEHYRKPPEQLVPLEMKEPPLALIEGLLALPRRIKPDPGDAKEIILDNPVGFNGGPLRYPLMVVPWGKGAGEVYLAFSREMDAYSEPGKDKHRNELSQRVTENAVRIATNVAVSRGSRVVEVEDIDHGIKLMRHSFEAAVGGFSKYMKRYIEFPQRCDEAIAWIKTMPDGFVSMTEWWRKQGRNAKWGTKETQDVANQLIKERRMKYEESYRRSMKGPAMEGYRFLPDDEE
jgi:hypothetical protein